MKGLEGYLDAEERVRRRWGGTSLRLVRVVGHFPLALTAGVTLVGVTTAANLWEPRLFGLAIDNAILPKRGDLLGRYTVGLAALMSLRIAAMIGQSLTFEWLGQRVSERLRTQLFERLLRLPLAIHDKNPSGRLLTRVTNDVAAIAEMFSSGIVSVVANVLQVVGIIVWLQALDPQLGLISISVFPLMAIASVYFSRRLAVAYREARSRLSALNAFLAENLMGMRVIQLFAREKIHAERYSRLNAWYAESQFGSTRVFALFQPSITLAAGATMALVIVYGGARVEQGQVKVGVLVAFFTYVLSLFQPLREIADKWNLFLSGMASAERVFSLLEWPIELPSEESVASSIPTKPWGGQLEFDQVHFAYGGTMPEGAVEPRWALKGLSVSLPAGSRVGVVGHTGAGKSTLIGLLMRFYEPQRGTIKIDGQDLRSIERSELRRRIGIVQQDVYLFSGSLAENVFLESKPEAARIHRLRQRLAELSLEHWWKELSQVGELRERANNLSTGQRQKLSFLRTLAADPDLWILDEATASMDSETEGEMQRALQAASRGRTTITVAHRLATVKDCDLTLVLHQGTLIERGTHLSLMRQNGLYSRMFKYQQASDGLPTV